jgi:hypothetical protein
VELITAGARPAHRQSGEFSGGAFSVQQERSDLTDLQLVGGRPRSRVCASASGAGPSTLARIARAVRTLHGSAHGHFRTSGRYAAATVRGTEWTTTDTCAGTSVSAQRGEVMTKTLKTPLNFPLTPGQNVLFVCGFRGPASLANLVCIGLLTTDRIGVFGGHRVRVVNFGAGLAAVTPDHFYDLCVQPPSNSATPSGCAAFPFGPPDSHGFRSAGVGCVPSQAGTYLVSWVLDGVQLGPLAYRAPAASPVLFPCTGFVGPNDPGSHRAALGEDFEAVNPYVIPTGSTLDDIGVWLAPTGRRGQQVLRGVVYTDDNGHPGALLATTDELVFHSTDADQLYKLSFPTKPVLTAGKIWIGLISGGTGGVAAYHYDAVPSSSSSPTYDGTPREVGSATYATGPPDPFAPLASDDQRMSLYLDYYLHQ